MHAILAPRRSSPRYQLAERVNDRPPCPAVHAAYSVHCHVRRCPSAVHPGALCNTVSYMVSEYDIRVSENHANINIMRTGFYADLYIHAH